MSSPLLAALTAPPGPHPPLAELRAYAAGTLSGAAAHGIEAHTLACARCADVLAGLEITDATTTDRAVADLQQRLRQRVGELSGRPNVVAPMRFRSRAWPHLAAAAALVAGLGAGLWGWQHRPAAESKSTEVAVQSAPAPTPRPAPQAPAPSGAAEMPAPPAAPGGSPPPVAAAAPSEAARAVQPTKADRLLAASAARPAPQRPGNPGNSGNSNAATEADVEANAGRSAPSSAAPADSAARAGELALRRPGSDTTGLAEVAYLRADQAAPRKMSVAKAKMAARAAASQAAASQASAPPAAAPARQETAAVVAGRASAKTSAAEAASAPRTRAALPPPPTLEPAPVGGYRALRTYLRQQAEAFAPEANQPSIKGLVRVRFTVSAAGKPALDQAEILQSLRADYDAEVLRMLSEGPAWVPGVAAGRRAPLPVQVEVLF